MLGVNLEGLNIFFSQIKDQKSVRITLPVKDSSDTERINCVYGASKAPVFFLYFRKSDLQTEHIDLEKKCVVTADFGGQIIAITASIDLVRNDQALQLTARETITHEQSRNYFRVDASAPIKASILQGKHNWLEDEENEKLSGETLDISGSGCLCIFKSPIEEGKKLKIEMALPTNTDEFVQIIGHVVRCRQVKSNLYHIGLHFDDLSSEDRDKIMGSCFEMQRRHLRMRIRVSTSQ